MWTPSEIAVEALILSGCVVMQLAKLAPRGICSIIIAKEEKLCWLPHQPRGIAKVRRKHPTRRISHYKDPSAASLGATGCRFWGTDR